MKTQLKIFVVLLLLVEIILRLFGMKAGTLLDEFKIEDKPVYVPRFKSDEAGINYIALKKDLLITGSVINNEGFRSRIDYTPSAIDSIRLQAKKEVVMIIGDSFVEGCCPDSVYHSFPDIINRTPEFGVLNFGVAGTDILQYRLVAKKYIPRIKPDKVVVVVYFGNDILSFERVPTPGVPICFSFRDNKWIYQVAPNHLSGKLNYSFKTADEAYGFYLEHYTLRGDNRNLFEKTLGYSVIFSKIYLYVEHRLARRSWEKKNPGLKVDVDLITYSGLSKIKRFCDSLNQPCIFVGIPAPLEASEGRALKEKYKNLFRDIEWFVPDNLTKKDYDGNDVSNHLNNEGHRKYAEFLNAILKRHKKVQALNGHKVTDTRN